MRGIPDDCRHILRMPPAGKARPGLPWPNIHFPLIVCGFLPRNQNPQCGCRLATPPAFLRVGVHRSIIVLSLWCLSPVRRESSPLFTAEICARDRYSETGTPAGMSGKDEPPFRGALVCICDIMLIIGGSGVRVSSVFAGWAHSSGQSRDGNSVWHNCKGRTTQRVIQCQAR